ncbi:hypothetical protein COX85_01925, partial [Candidatus Micrarchaeota archaeon CG_4_10_14_0_2_um_filter_55_9]
MSEYDDSDESSPQESGNEEKTERRSQGDSDRETYKTVCSDCGQECEVPFKPTEGRPVYCRECFKKHRKPRRSYGGGGGGGYGGSRGGGGRGGYGRRDD